MVFDNNYQVSKVNIRHIPFDNAGLQSVSAVQDGLRRGSRISAADQVLPLEV